MNREICKKNCCWSPQDVCRNRRKCACHPESRHERERREALARIKGE